MTEAMVERAAVVAATNAARAISNEQLENRTEEPTNAVPVSSSNNPTSATPAVAAAPLDNLPPVNDDCRSNGCPVVEQQDVRVESKAEFTRSSPRWVKVLLVKLSR